ncbi:MAG: hypothetical protein ACYCQI_09110 [Gammaproteobacteria bacterium]
MPFSDNIYRFYNKAQSLTKYAAIGCVLGTTIGLIKSARIQNELGEVDCNKMPVSMMHYRGGFGDAIAALSIELVLHGICEFSKIAPGSQIIGPLLFFRCSMASLGAGLGLLVGYSIDDHLRIMRGPS